VYTLSGSCPEEHLQRISRYIDRKIQDARKTKPITAYNFDLNTLFIIINMVDELFNKSDKVQALEVDTVKLANENKNIKAENENLKAKLAEARKQLDEERKTGGEAEKKEVKK